MKATRLCFATVVTMGSLLLAGTLNAQARADAPVLLQAAVHQETVDGNLDSAITLYRRIAGDRRADRATIARALVGLGRAHETLGQAEAQRAYERVVNEFGDQQEQAAQARRRLQALAQMDAKATVSGGLSLRRIWHDPGVDMEGQPTPDGKLLTFVDWETGDLAVREVATGATRLLTKTGYPQYALGSSVSRDGRKVAFFWTLGEGKDWQPQLRVVGIDGSGEKVLVANADRDVSYFTPYEWTPDGTHVLVVITRRGGIELALIDTRTGAIRTVKSMDWRLPMRASLSPDGRWIAYDFQVSRDASQRDLYVLAADGSAEHRLTEHPANDLHAVWTSNEQIIFASNRGGAVGLWRLNVRNGLPEGDAELVKGDMTAGFYPMAVTPSGTLFYSQDIGGGDIFTVAFDTAAARVVGAPTKFVQRYQGLNAAADFSRAGDVVVYTSRREALSMGHTVGLHLYDVKSGTERNLRVYTTRPFARPSISPDGKQALVWSRTLRGGDFIMLVDLATGSRRTVVEPVVQADGYLGNAVWSQDGAHFYYFRSDRGGVDGAAPRLVKRSIESGEETVVHRFDLAWARWTWALSPDERSIAYSGRIPAPERPSVLEREVHFIRVAPVGGESRELVRIEPPRGVSHRSNLAWTPDAKHVLFGLSADRRWVGNPEVTLYAVPAAGGAPKETGLKLHELRHISFLTDGRTLSFTAGPVEFNEVWIMENLRTALSR